MTERQVRRIDNLEAAHDAADFGVEPRTGVERDLGDEVRSELRPVIGLTKVVRVKLGAGERGIGCRQDTGGTATGTTQILVAALSGETKGHRVARVEKDAQLAEFKCVEFTEQLLYGDLVRKPGK